MEGSSSLSYKGTISDAISTARLQKKLFLVYVSGEDENSVRLEQSTWIDPNVADAVSKCCIFLHLKHGSVEASQFSAIYPQSSIPSITAVGLNGVIIWKNEGFITAENFVENIEKAWAALRLQETAAALLSVALSSRNSEPLQSDVSGHEAVEPENSSTLETPLVLSHESSLPAGIDGSSSNVEQLIDRNINKSSFDKNNNIHEEVCPESTDKCSKQIAIEDQPESSGETTEEGFYSVGKSVDSHVTSTVEDVNATAEGSGQNDERSTSNLTQANCPALEETSEKLHGDNTCGSETQNNEAHKSQNSTKSNEILLNIRLPNGSSLQAKFVITDTLSSVKSCVDQNQNTGMGSYDLAIPYPRRTFGEEDMDRTFTELGFPSRQAMIVVPHRQVNQAQRGLSSSNNNDIASTSTANNGGSLGFLRRMLSYANPFSYLGGNSNSSSAPLEHNNSLRHFRPNRDLRNHPSGAEASGHEQTPSTSNTGNRSRTPTSSPFGSNIHTLRHDEDDGQPADRNTFWNGNSTQYGGNDR